MLTHLPNYMEIYSLMELSVVWLKKYKRLSKISQIKDLLGFYLMDSLINGQSLWAKSTQRVIFLNLMATFYLLMKRLNSYLNVKICRRHLQVSWYMLAFCLLTNLWSGKMFLTGLWIPNSVRFSESLSF